MAVHYQTRGLIVRKSERGEADQILNVYTENFGKLNILGRGIRKNASKLLGGADLFYFSDIEFIQGRSQKILTDAALIENYSAIRQNPDKMKIAHQIADTLNALVANEEKDLQIWRLLNEVFNKLNNCSNGKLQIIYYYFFWNLAAILGYQPELTSNSLGGELIDGDLAKILKLLFQKDWPILTRLKIESSHYELLKNTSECYNKNTIAVNYEK